MSGPDDGFYGGAEAEAVAGGSGSAADGSLGEVEAARYRIDREAGREQPEELQVGVADLAMQHDIPGSWEGFIAQDGHPDHLVPNTRDSAASQSAGLPCGSYRRS